MLDNKNNIEDSLSNNTNSNINIDNSKVINNNIISIELIIFLIIVVIVFIGAYYFTQNSSSSNIIKSTTKNINSDKIIVDKSTNKTINTTIKDSYNTYNTTNNISNTTNITNDPNLIEKLIEKINKKTSENTELKNVIELFLKKNYDTTIDKLNKENKSIIIYISELLDGDSIYKMIEKIEKLEKGLKKLNELITEAKDEKTKAILIEVDRAFREFNFDKYQKLLDKYQDSISGDVSQNKNLAKSYYLKAIIYYNNLKFKDALKYIAKALELDVENSLYINDYGNYLFTLNEVLKNSDRVLKKYFQDRSMDYNKTIKYNIILNLKEFLDIQSKYLKHYEKILEANLKKLSKNNSTILTYYNKLCGVFFYTEYDKAIKYCTKALKVDLKKLDKNHPDIGTRYYLLGTLYDNKKEYNKAIKYYQKALKINLQNYGENNHTIYNYTALARMYMNINKYNKAMEYYNKSLPTLIQNFEENKNLIANVYYNLGIFYGKQKKFNRAIEYLKKSLNIYKDIYKDENHPDVQNTKRSLELIIKIQNQSKFN